MSSPERSPPPGSSLFTRLVGALHDRILDSGDGERAYDAVKLVHAKDLWRWDRFPRCQDFDGITHGEYRSERRRLERRRRSVSNLLDWQRELIEKDTDEVVEYRSDLLDVPRSLVRRRLRLPLPATPQPGTWVESSAGRVDDEWLEVAAGWRNQAVWLRYLGPSRVVHAERIQQLQELLDAMSDEQRRTLAEVTASPYAQPVLFVSHRWEDRAHPDPSGRQLRRLRTLEDCYLIYDYSSFPQPPRSEEEEIRLRGILSEMDGLVGNVVVLGAPDYLTRGWCLYEYLVASLRTTTVCDEIQDERFVALRDWASTPPPVSMRFRDGFESQQQNFINERILASVNEILPLYARAGFQEERDREIVTGLLVKHLKQTLPPKKDSQAYLGEWKTTGWTDDDLVPFFAGEAKVPELEGNLGISRFETSVPATLEEAVEHRYTVRRYDWRRLLNPADSVLRFTFRQE